MGRRSRWTIDRTEHTTVVGCGLCAWRNLLILGTEWEARMSLLEHTYAAHSVEGQGQISTLRHWMARQGKPCGVMAR